MLMFNADELFERLGLTVNCEDCKRHNKDYINKCDNSTWMEVCDILDYMTPIDAEPVVRCKDCKWYGRVDKRRFYRGMDCLQKHIDTIVPDRDFCSKAERRGEQDG